MRWAAGGRFWGGRGRGRAALGRGIEEGNVAAITRHRHPALHQLLVRRCKWGRSLRCLLNLGPIRSPSTRSQGGIKYLQFSPSPRHSLHPFRPGTCCCCSHSHLPCPIAFPILPCAFRFTSPTCAFLPPWSLRVVCRVLKLFPHFNRNVFLEVCYSTGCRSAPHHHGLPLVLVAAVNCSWRG